MNELIAALVIIVLWLWLLWDRAKHPSEYARAYAELEKAMEAVKSEFALTLLPALKDVAAGMARFAEAAEKLGDAFEQK
jgi:hypothetical protein